MWTRRDPVEVDDVRGFWGDGAPVPAGSRQAAEADFVRGYLEREGAMPASANEGAVATAMPTCRVPASRNGPLYRAHSYHTKVPPEAIAAFVEHYSSPGDVVLDPFCGSGMTGVAAAMAGRRSILNDLSPAAAHLSWNHTRECDPDALGRGFADLEAKVGGYLDALYATTHSDGSPARIHWTMWSTRHRCPHCGVEFPLWDAVDKATGRLGRAVVAPCCSREIGRAGLASLGSAPAWVSYESADGRRHERAPTAADVAAATGHERSSIGHWYPDVPLSDDREMYVRCALKLRGVASVADLYTVRNLKALASIWDAVLATGDGRVRRALAFAFTNTAWHGTRMRRYNARGGQRPLTGTLYVPQLSSEANVLEVMRNKVEQLKGYYRTFASLAGEPVVTLGSATALTSVADGSVDYVFTDPPFGSNIFYADCNLVWEAWLGRLTDATEEAVVNRSLKPGRGGKTLADYAALMDGAMSEVARVLKPGGWATVVFNNTDKDVWRALRDAAVRAGFEFHEAASLDRRQLSHKGYKGRSGAEDVAHFDVVFSLRKRAPGRSATPVTSSVPEDLATLVAAARSDAGIAAGGLQSVHAEVMRTLASRSDGTFVDFECVRAAYEATSGIVL